jgi:SOUL heme-binding protein
MTAPVLQQAAGKRIAMTAPVVQREDGRPGSHVVAFVMPAHETLETLPEPDDVKVTLREVPAEFAAALRYSGRWTQSGYQERVARLQQAMADAGLQATGQPRWARFNPPWTPWFLRRNEVVIPVATP